MFQIGRFIEECQAAVKESDALSAVNELVALRRELRPARAAGP